MGLGKDSERHSHARKISDALYIGYRPPKLVASLFLSKLQVR